MSSKPDVWQGTLALMVLKTLERTSADLLSVNYGTLYSALLKLEQKGCTASERGVSENNRKAKYYRLTQAGQKQQEKKTREWEQICAILARFLNPGEGLA